MSSLKLKKPAALEKALSTKLPEKLEVGAEVERGLEKRLHLRFNELGQWDRSSAPAQLVDLWVQRGGLAFTTEVLCLIGDRNVPRENPPGIGAYSLKRNGQPWLRLREHVVACDDAKAVAAAKQVAAPFFAKSKNKQKVYPESHTELRCALAAVFGDEDWVEACIEPMIEKGYGRWVMLHAITDPKQALSVARRLIDFHTRYQVYEEAVVHLLPLFTAAGRPGLAVLQALIDDGYGKWTGELVKIRTAVQATVPT